MKVEGIAGETISWVLRNLVLLWEEEGERERVDARIYKL